MNISRREIGMLLPALATVAAAQQANAALPSKVYETEAIPYTGDAKKKGRRFFQGTTHTGFHLEMHETQLGPGEISHPPHKHVNEEVIVIVEGTIDVSIEGKATRANAGSVTYFASNDLHNFKNVGTGTCRYYVLELHGDTA
ncbi:MAG TPA: cupin domain-containing protein [Bryobacteraceae bacterium]|nr:cupin domain-containing protein [Bryobacteraceae bacterium]